MPGASKALGAETQSRERGVTASPPGSIMNKTLSISKRLANVPPQPRESAFSDIPDGAEQGVCGSGAIGYVSGLGIAQEGMKCKSVRGPRWRDLE